MTSQQIEAVRKAAREAFEDNHPADQGRFGKDRHGRYLDHVIQSKLVSFISGWVMGFISASNGEHPLWVDVPDILRRDK